MQSRTVLCSGAEQTERLRTSRGNIRLAIRFQSTDPRWPSAPAGSKFSPRHPLWAEPCWRDSEIYSEILLPRLRKGKLFKNYLPRKKPKVFMRGKLEIIKICPEITLRKNIGISELLPT